MMLFVVSLVENLEFEEMDENGIRNFNFRNEKNLQASWIDPSATRHFLNRKVNAMSEIEIEQHELDFLKDHVWYYS